MTSPGYSTSAIVLQLPEGKVTKNREPVADADAKNAVVGVWSTTDRRRLQVTNATGAGSQSQGPVTARTATCRSRGSATRWSTRS